MDIINSSIGSLRKTWKKGDPSHDDDTRYSAIRAYPAGYGPRHKIETFPETFEEWEMSAPELIALAIEEGKSGKSSPHSKEFLARIREILTVTLDGAVVSYPTTLLHLEALAPEIVEQARERGRAMKAAAPPVIPSAKPAEPTTSLTGASPLKESSTGTTPQSLEEIWRSEFRNSPEIQKAYKTFPEPCEAYVRGQRRVAEMKWDAYLRSRDK